MILCGSPQSVVQQIRRIHGELGNGISGVTVTFTPPTEGASGSFGGNTSVTTNALGYANAPAFTANTITGSYAVSAAAGLRALDAGLLSLVVGLYLGATMSALGRALFRAGVFAPWIAVTSSMSVSPSSQARKNDTCDR